jgi:hypothetical protein
LNAKSIRDSPLAQVRAVFGWDAANRRLTENVAARVTIDLKAKPSERRRGPTDEDPPSWRNNAEESLFRSIHEV